MMCRCPVGNAARIKLLADEANVMEVRLMYRVFGDCDVIQKRGRPRGTAARSAHARGASQ